MTKMTKNDPAIRISQLRKTYRDGKKGEEKEALKGIDLEVPRGSFFGLLGPNGAGKSTMINIMAGLTLKSSGTVEICGYDIIDQTRKARMSLGVVPQELVLDTFFTVRQALEITAGYYGIPKAKRRTQEIIDAMGLTDKADVSARRLSGGMRRRLLVGKALVHSPDVLILDEPTAGVDVELRTQLWEYVRKLNEAGTTIVLTTHYLEEAEELCDEIAIINHGEIIAHEKKEALMQGFDSKELVLTLEQTITEIPEALKDLQTGICDGKLVIKYQPSQTSFASLMERVNKAGLSICDLSTREVDLEDVFRHLTSDQAA
ncbi:MAG: ABC transporter ATP-binding protein [Rickettsiales bacterium]|nr:ABC transporter ATP-binding protein [Rickettsiales bacterium]